MLVDAEAINEIAAELGVSPAFIEKDWYAVQVLKAIASFQSEHVEVIFSGGTSLSKGYQVIQRFSEDLDFRCRYIQPNSGNQNKKIRSVFRAQILNSIQSIEHISLDESKLSVASNYIKLSLQYPQQLEQHSSLRPHLEVEFSFTQPQLTPQRLPVRSFVAQFTNAQPEAEILCLSPIETGADKLSALAWRIIKRDRNSPADDPAIMRHLHDLCALAPIIEEHKEMFVKAAQASFDIDQATGRRDLDSSLSSALQLAAKKMQTDPLYKEEYQRFVSAMSYAADADDIGFNQALEFFDCLSQWY